jgi:4-amino-4-deoxy-L-arabinose transferase-like glycosyltransferase
VQTIAKHAAGSIILLIAISLGVLFFRLGSLPLSGADEPRYARIAEEMYRQGEWITPTLQGIPWLEKPPLYYWITIPFYSLFEVKETAARLGPAFSALITALAIFWLGSTLRNRTAGLLAASMLLTSLGFIGFGRSASTDMPFTCCLTLSMAILAAAVKKDPGAVKILPAFVFLGLAVLGKGPVALILAAGIIFCFWFFNERGDALARWRIVPGFILIFMACIPWFWLAFKENGYIFITTFFINHNIARYVTDIHHHSQPFYYYIPVLLALLFPWSGWLPFLFSRSPLKEIRRWRDWDPVTLFLFCWFLFPLVFFSLSESKLSGYILPSLPPLTLILGMRITESIERPAGSTALRISMIVTLTISLIMAVAAPIYFQKEYGGNLKTGLILAAVLFLPSLFSAIYGFRGQALRAYTATLLQGLLLIVTVALFAFPILGDYHSTRDIAKRSLEVRKADEPIITYGFMHHSLHYYTGYQVQEKVDNPALLLHLFPNHKQYLVVAKENKIQEIRDIKGLSLEILGEQGPFRLLRLSKD